MVQIDITDWRPLVVGSGGLMSLAALLFKPFMDAKEERIQVLKDINVDLNEKIKALRGENAKLESRLEQLQDKYDQTLEELEHVKEKLSEISDKLSQKGVEVPALKNLLQEWDRLHVALAKTQVAAQWVEHKKEEWLRQATEAALSQYSDLIPESQKYAFGQDIANYLRWLHESLSLGFCCRVEDYVQTRAIESLFPYRAAFKELREIRDFGDLHPDEIQILQEYLDELVHDALD